MFVFTMYAWVGVVNPKSCTVLQFDYFIRYLLDIKLIYKLFSTSCSLLLIDGSIFNIFPFYYGPCFLFLLETDWAVHIEL